MAGRSSGRSGERLGRTWLDEEPRPEAGGDPSADDAFGATADDAAELDDVLGATAEEAAALRAGPGAPMVRSGVVPAGSAAGAYGPGDDEDPLPSGTVLLGKLRVVRLLGRGGMGSVYEVEHVLTRHRRALKVMHRALCRQAGLAARFVREVGIAARVASPYLVETYDAGVLDDGTPYALMELLHGETLQARLQREGRLPPREAIAIVAEVAQGVADAHRAGILHRDLKPDNVWLERGEDGSTRVRILDFGIARPLSCELDGGTDLTITGALLGTPHYVAPEHAASETPDERADVYALGVILYELLAGRRPFEEENLFALLGRIVAGEHPPLGTVAPHVGPDVEAVVRHAMARLPDQRCPSARMLLADLQALLEAPAAAAPVVAAVVPVEVDDAAPTLVRNVDRERRVSTVPPLAAPAGLLGSLRDRRVQSILVLALASGVAVGIVLALLGPR